MGKGAYCLASFSLVILLSLGANGQVLKQKFLDAKSPIICYAGEEHSTIIPAPEAYRKLRENAVGRIKTATIDVTYIGFTPEAQAAFQHAVDIWETQITSTVPIRVTALWQALDEGVLGSAIWGRVYANFAGAQLINTYYPVALAEKMVGQELNDPTDPDIFANFSSSINWYYNTSGTPASGQYDLVTVVLHELGHGLGIVDSYSASGTTGSVGVQDSDIPMIFDRYIENTAGQNLYVDFTSPSAALRTQLTSNSLFFDSPTVLDVNGSQRGKVYAPAEFSGGSSIAHLDESSYNGTINALMTPQVGAREVIHDPGPITIGILSDMGWEFTRISHIPLKESENVNGPYTVTAAITTDKGPIATPKLLYSIGAGEIEIAMTPTGTPNEYTAQIPGTGAPTNYGYYISVNDASGRSYTNPGVLSDPGEDPLQFYNLFSTGPDIKAPRITHSPKGFLLESNTELVVDAIISDNIGVGSATIEYLINDVAQSVVSMQPGTPDSLYSGTINLGGGLAVGDVLKYRIIAIDISSNLNQKVSPATDFHIVNVVELAATQDNYQNDFNNPSDDFFGNGFSVTTPIDFNSPAIHTIHPYEEGDGFPNNELNYVYQLKIPIRVKASDATIKFDEIVLIEPGSVDGPNFGDEEFFDFAVVEGSIDGGVTWTPIADGYDARTNTTWETKYNSSIIGNNSAAVGDPSLYNPRVMDLLSQFNEGDEVVIRFRVFSDPFAVGWGWAIDNLRIQIDDTPPLVLNDHIDYLLENEESISIHSNVTDASGIDELYIEYQINESPIEKFDFTPIPNQDDYTLTLNVTGLSVGDLIKYKIVAVDNSGNTGAFPPDGFIEVPKIEFDTPVSSYSNNFNTPTTDFVGNFFSIEQPSGFSDGLMQSTSPYVTGRGLNQTSNFNYVLRKPVTINTSNTYIRFDEIAIIENHPTSAAFGTAAFNDYVIIEGSKDGGANWLPFLTGYDAFAFFPWNSAYITQSEVDPSLFRRRTINMLENGNFTSGDNVLIRFRLYSDEEKNGYGWVIDNLHIQDIVTGVETTSSVRSFTLFPNPVQGDQLMLRIESHDLKEFELSIISAQGLPLQHQRIQMNNVIHEQAISTADLPNGVFLVKIAHKNGSQIKKFVVAR